ncbi:MAG: hypothetical protein ABI068_13640, partial [Ktedonobacterales bacterium]
ATSAPSSRLRSVSLPLAEAVIYRPGPYLALTVLLAPILSALGAAAVYLGLNGAIPLWLPLLLLLWIPLFVAVWFALKSVRFTAESIAVARPWQHWREIYLDDVEAAEMRGLYLRLYDTERHMVSFMPGLLRDGPRLRRQLLLQLPQRVLDAQLRQEAQLLNGVDLFSEERLIGGVQMRPRRRWAGTALLIALLCIGAGGVTWVSTPLVAAIPLATLAVIVAVLFVALAIWLRQDISLDDKGLYVRPFLRRSRRYIAWNDVELIITERRELTLYLRGARGVRCAGPALFRPQQCEQLRRYIVVYCGERHVPIMTRRVGGGLFSRLFTLR